jgi:hypothetical protein
MRAPITTVLATATLVAGIAGIAGCSTSGTSSPPPASPPASSAPPTSTHWLIAASAVSKLEAADGTAAVARYLDGPQTTIITPAAIPSGLASWNVTFALGTRSLAEISSGMTGLSSRISEILYDPEDWSFTPLAQQDNVGSATSQAASMAHTAGRKLIVTPATNLAPRGTFIQSDDLAKVAASANVVEIQAQGIERDPSNYAAFISQAVSQIRTANSSVTIYAGLSTNPSGATPTVAELVSDVRLTSAEISGYWLNIPSPGTACPKCGSAQPQIGYELLASLAQ